MDIIETLEQHLKWINNEGGQRADLRFDDLRDANLRDADLWDADLRDANLRDADLRGAFLLDADLRGADLWGADLRDADLRGADLRGADLWGADLRDADLRGADLLDADLRGADLSGVEGLISPSDYILEQFEVVDDGVIVYKTFGKNYSPPEFWDIEEGAELEETVNPCRTTDCASGVNVATRRWIEPTSKDIWKCLVRWEDMASIVVPYGTNGKIRAGRVQLLEIVD